MVGLQLVLVTLHLQLKISIEHGNKNSAIAISPLDLGTNKIYYVPLKKIVVFG